MELFSFTTNSKLVDIQWQAYPIGFFLLLLCLFTIISNFLIIYIVIVNDTLHQPKYYYISSLAFADLLIGLIVMPLAFVFEMTHDEYWLFKNNLKTLCVFRHSINIFASTASIFGLSAIGFDRYISITKPIQYRNTFISKRWYCILAFIWIFSATIAFLSVIYFGTEQQEHHIIHIHIDKYPSISNENISISSSLFQECHFPNNLYFVLFGSLAAFYLPLILMIYVYIKVYSAAKQQSIAHREGYKHHYLDKSIITGKKNSNILLKSCQLSAPELITLRIHHGSNQNNRNDDDNQSVSSMQRKNNFWKKICQDQKAKTFVGIIMGVFVICWLPYFIYSIFSDVFHIRVKNEENHILIFNIFSWLAYTNSALDVLIYIFTSKELQKTFLKLFSK